MTRCTVSGNVPVNPDDASVPNSATRPDGQHVDHWVLCAEERAKGFVRPLRTSYVHVGRPGPKYPLRDLTDAEKRKEFDRYYVKFEPYPESERPRTGRFWTQAEIDSIGKGCGTLTRMPMACAETYARQPGFYGLTFCCGCGKYLRVGADGEFVWDKTTNERVGT
jgi:hypothetical protein